MTGQNQEVGGSSGHSAPLRPILSIFSELYTDVGLPFQRVILDESKNAKNTQGPTFETIKAIDTKAIIMLSAIFMNNKWHNCWGSIALLQGHPIKDLKIFKQIFGTKRKKKWVDPDRTKIFRLQKILHELPTASLQLVTYNYNSRLVRLRLTISMFNGDSATSHLG